MAIDILEAASDTSVSKDVAVVESSGFDTPPNNSSVSDYRTTFLASFTPEEEKKIIRKVDMRLLVLAGVIYMVKQVS